MTCGGVCDVSGIMFRLRVRRKWSEVQGRNQHMISGAVSCVNKVQLVA